jgi:hypothetical protein
MIAGFCVEFYGHSETVGWWTQGVPTRGFLGGIKSKDAAGMPAIPIRTYRYAACGYLEAYARPEFEPT